MRPFIVLSAASANLASIIRSAIAFPSGKISPERCYTRDEPIRQLLYIPQFELPIPICEQSDDSVRLGIATSRRTQSAITLQRISSALQGSSERPGQNGVPISGLLLRNQARCPSIPHRSEEHT